jgi:hypothetical protein
MDESTTGTHKRQPTAKVMENADPLLHVKQCRLAIPHSTHLAQDSEHDKVDDLPKSSDEEEGHDSCEPTTSSPVSSHGIALSGNEKSDTEDENEIEIVDPPSEDPSAELGMCYRCMLSITKC